MSAPAYLIADVSVTDMAAYAPYIAAVPALIARHGGSYLVRGGNPEVIEGSWSTSRLIVMKFPSRAAAIAFHDDPDYAPFLALRQSLGETRLVLVDGLE